MGETTKRRYPDRSPDALAERRSRIVTLCRSGLTVREAAARVGVGISAVTQARREAGLAKPRPPRMSAEELARAKAMLDDGASYAEVARTLGRGRMAIARRFPGFGWSMAERDEYMRNVRKFEGNNQRPILRMARWAGDLR
jgi:transposase